MSKTTMCELIDTLGNFDLEVLQERLVDDGVIDESHLDNPIEDFISFLTVSMDDNIDQDHFRINQMQSLIAKLDALRLFHLAQDELGAETGYYPDLDDDLSKYVYGPAVENFKSALLSI